MPFAGVNLRQEDIASFLAACQQAGVERLVAAAVVEGQPADEPIVGAELEELGDAEAANGGRPAADQRALRFPGLTGGVNEQ